MKRQITVITLCAMLFALCGSAEAQQPGKIFRIGFLDPSTASGSVVLVDAFWQEMRKLGWIEGKNISVDYRFLDGRRERMSEVAAELVRLKIDLIVVTGVQAALAATKAIRPSLLCLRALLILWGWVWSLVWRGREGMSQDFPV